MNVRERLLSIKIKEKIVKQQRYAEKIGVIATIREKGNTPNKKNMGTVIHG